MPQNRKNASIVFEFDKVKDEGVDDAEGQSVLLVEESLDEDAVGAGILHLGQFQKRRADRVAKDKVRGRAEERKSGGYFKETSTLANSYLRKTHDYICK